MERSGSDAERRLCAMETAFERERQQRNLLEKKYARLKRRYVRLERSHNRLLMESHGKINNGMQAPTPQAEMPGSVESTPNSETSTVSRALHFAVIDLTSPRPSSSAAVRSNSGSLDSTSRGLHSSGPDMLWRDDICAESPSSALGSPQLSTRQSRNNEDQEEKENTVDNWRRRPDSIQSSPTSRRRLQLDFTLPSNLTDLNRPLSRPPRRTQHHLPHSDQSTSSQSSPPAAHSMTTRSGEPRTQTRPRLRLHHQSPERTAAPAYGYQLEEELEPRAHCQVRYRWTTDSSPEPSTPSQMASSPLMPTNPLPLPPTVPSPAALPTVQSEEEASLALARYLQQQENIAAYEEYEARLLGESGQQEFNERSRLSSSSGLMGHQRNIDPDNMTYEELLRLGEEVGDVKKERWRRMAVQVLSSLPTHRWARGHGEDTCIICQYNFVPNDQAMTLPCAHVFHEDCVGGWIHENNCCPLCKREITSM